MDGHNVEWAMFCVRLLVGITFVFHGAQKLFGAWGGPGLKGWTGYVAQGMGMPAPAAALAAIFEFFGGVLVLLGIAPQVGAAMTGSVMLVAVLTRLKGGYADMENGFQYSLNMLLASLAIILGGGGALALWSPWG